MAVRNYQHEMQNAEGGRDLSRHFDHRKCNSVAGAFQADTRIHRSFGLAIGGFVIGSSPLISRRTVPRRLTFSPGASQK